MRAQGGAEGGSAGRGSGARMPRTCMRLAGSPHPSKPVYDFAMGQWIAEEFAGPERLIAPLPKAKVPRLTAAEQFGGAATRARAAEALGALEFESWWDENNPDGLGVFLDDGERVSTGLRRRRMRVRYDLGTRDTTAVVDVAGRPVELPAGAGAGHRYSPWDMYVGGHIHVLGKPVTLMAASCATQAWVNHHGEHLARVRAQLRAEVAKYEMRRVPGAQGRALPAGGGRHPLRVLALQCAQLIDQLARFRPRRAEEHARALVSYLGDGDDDEAGGGRRAGGGDAGAGGAGASRPPSGHHPPPEAAAAGAAAGGAAA